MLQPLLFFAVLELAAAWPLPRPATAAMGGLLVFVPAFAVFAPARRCAPSTGGFLGAPGGGRAGKQRAADQHAQEVKRHNG